MPALSPDELALFGNPPPAAPVADFDDPFGDMPSVIPAPAPAVQTATPTPASTPVNDPGLPPPPVPSRRLTIQEVQSAPTCSACGVELNADNGSKNRAGEWKHVGCPMATPTVIANTTITTDPGAVFAPVSVGYVETFAGATPAPAPAPARRGRPPKAATNITTTENSGIINGKIVLPQTTYIELGPETLEVLRALIRTLTP